MHVVVEASILLSDTSPKPSSLIFMHGLGRLTLLGKTDFPVWWNRNFDSVTPLLRDVEAQNRHGLDTITASR
jgi:hypothetical protein